MIYLDPMGHLFSTESFEELYDFGVRKMRMKPEWNHYSKHFPHFDLTTQRMKSKAVSLGAVKIKELREASPIIREAEIVFKEFYEKHRSNKYWFKGKGLLKQDILRVNFDKVLKLERECMKKVIVILLGLPVTIPGVFIAFMAEVLESLSDIYDSRVVSPYRRLLFRVFKLKKDE